MLQFQQCSDRPVASDCRGIEEGRRQRSNSEQGAAICPAGLASQSRFGAAAILELTKQTTRIEGCCLGARNITVFKIK